MPRFFFAFTLVAVWALQAQSPPEYEVVSIRPYVSQGNAASDPSEVDFPPGRFAATNIKVRTLMRMAFGVENERILDAPDWVDTLSYNINAETFGGVQVAGNNIGELMKSLLVSRFGLKVHRETRDVQEYDLEVAKSGFKLTPDTGDAKPSMRTSSNDGVVVLNVTKLSMAGLALNLTRRLGRPVVDKTSVVGNFDFDLKWSPDQAVENAGPSIFTALQEIGLRLVSTKGPVEVIVVDRVEKPSAN